MFVCFFFQFTDIESPIITGMPASFTQNTDKGLPTATVFWIEPTASDNSGSQTLTSSQSPGSTFDIGVTSVIYKCVDPSGNVVIMSFTVTIEGKDTILKGFHI